MVVLKTLVYLRLQLLLPLALATEGGDHLLDVRVVAQVGRHDAQEGGLCRLASLLLAVELASTKGTPPPTSTTGVPGSRGSRASRVVKGSFLVSAATGCMGSCRIIRSTDTSNTAARVWSISAAAVVVTARSSTTMASASSSALNRTLSILKCAAVRSKSL